jgi:hypothetical protein
MEWLFSIRGGGLIKKIVFITDTGSRFKLTNKPLSYFQE